MHLLESDLPTVDDIAEAESFGAIALVGIVELLAIDQGASIVDAHDASDGRRDLFFARLQDLVIDAARKAHDAFLSGQVLQELDVLLFIEFFFAHAYSKTSSPIKVAELEAVIFTFTKSPMR